ncbi:MAG: NRDE family protein [Leucobacter sp.]
MCTVILEVPENPGEAIRVLAVRDEDPSRAWDPVGLWWPEHYPGVLGVRDRRAGGAWLAALPSASRLSVLLNRGESVPYPADSLLSRGGLVLNSVTGLEVDDSPRTGAFNLVEMRGEEQHADVRSGIGSVTVTGWNGSSVKRERLTPGVHMIAHGWVDDPATARISRWLHEFRTLSGLPTNEWRDRWLALLETTTSLSPQDDQAIIRDNRPHGYPTQSLLVCTAEITSHGVDLATRIFDEPGEW